MHTQHLLKIRHERRDLGFYSASVVREDGLQQAWSLSIQSPADADEFRVHLASGSSMELSMLTRDGELLRGNACVSSLSDAVDAATIVKLAGVGPLHRG